MHRLEDRSTIARIDVASSNPRSWLWHERSEQGRLLHRYLRKHAEGATAFDVGLSHAINESGSAHAVR